MSKRTGRITTLEVDDGGGFDPVGNIIDVSYNPTVNQIDATDRDDGGFDSQLYGHFHGTIEANVHYNEADPGQEQLRTALNAKTTLIARYRQHGNEGGSRQITGTVTLETNPQEGPLRDSGKQSYTLHFSTAPTFDTI